MSTLPYITLAQLTAGIQRAISNTFNGQSFWVVADVTSHSYYSAKGYHYFDLVQKDPHSHQMVARVPGSAWGNGAARIRSFEQVTGQRFGNGMHVLVKVAVEYHPVYGLKLSLLDIDTSFTIGLLEQQKQATLQQLLADCSDIIRKTEEGYMTYNKRLRMNRVIQRIAVISSPASAGYQDFMHTLQSNAYGYTFYTDAYFTAVQGAANAVQVCAQLEAIKAAGSTYDTVVMIRGGGAQTDLLIFDQYPLARAVAGFPVPVITGIGHQTNETITDLLAHTATRTPTRAAEFIIAHNRSFEETMHALQQQIVIRSQQLMGAGRQALSFLQAGIVNRSRDLLAEHSQGLARQRQNLPHTARNILFRQQAGQAQLAAQLMAHPLRITAGNRQQLQHMQQRLALFARALLQQQQQQLQHHHTVVQLMSPAQLLRKGFALVYHKGSIATSAAGLAAGDIITVQLADAALTAGIINKTTTDGNEPDI